MEEASFVAGKFSEIINKFTLKGRSKTGDVKIWHSYN